MIDSLDFGVNVILADEMGLGKTLMALAVISALDARGEEMPTLIVVPLSTLHQWRAEQTKWTPHLQLVTYYGTAAERNTTWEEWSNAAPKRRPQIMLTTYDTIKSDSTRLARGDWGTLIVDEAHRLKGCAANVATMQQRPDSPPTIMCSAEPRMT